MRASGPLHRDVRRPTASTLNSSFLTYSQCDAGASHPLPNSAFVQPLNSSLLTVPLGLHGCLRSWQPSQPTRYRPLAVRRTPAVTGRSEQREPRSGGLRSSTPGNSSETVSKELVESCAASLDRLPR